MDNVEEPELEEAEEQEEPRGPSWWARLMERTPAWVLAILVVAALTFLELLFDKYRLKMQLWANWIEKTKEISFAVLILGTIYLAGALKRRNWRHVLVMLGVMVVGEGGGLFQGRLWTPVPFPFDLIVWVCVTPLFVGLGEWLLTKPRTLRGFLGILLAATAASCLIPLIQKPLQYADLQFVAHWQGYLRGHGFGTMIFLPLVAAVTWVAVPLALKVAATRKARPALIAAGAVAACVGAFLWFFYAGVHFLAAQSLEGHGLFAPGYAAALLEWRGRPSDIEAIWRTLDGADWTDDLYDSNEHRARSELLAIVKRHDPPAAATRLSQLLRRHPSGELAYLAAPFLAKHGRQEAGPVLLWHSLDASHQIHSECTDALATMGLPWAAPDLIFRIPRIRQNNNQDSTNPTLTAEERAQLIRLLGKDAGATYKDWLTSADELIHAAGAGYPAPFREEMDSVLGHALRYLELRDLQYKAECRLFVRRIKEAGKGAVMQNLVEKRGELKELGLWPDDVVRLEMEHKVPGWKEAEPVFEKMRNSARKDMKVPAPVWRREGVKALEEEVARYEREVDEKIARLLPPATQPATRPAMREATREATRRDQGER